MASSLYMNYEMEKDGCKVVINRNTFRAFRKISPKTAAKMLHKWADEIARLGDDNPDEKDEE